MNIEELWKILDKEKKSEALQALDVNFYKNASEYIRELEKERVSADGTQKTRIIDDELKSARRAVEDIFDRRMRKIVGEALFRAKGHRSEMRGLTEYEVEIFDGVQKSIEAGRKKILDMVEGYQNLPGGHSEDKGLKDSPSAGKNEPKAVPDLETSPEPPKKETSEETASRKSDPPPTEFWIVRALREIPAFAGTDGRTYRVAQDEITMLPKANAEALCKRGAMAIVNAKISADAQSH